MNNIPDFIKNTFLFKDLVKNDDKDSILEVDCIKKLIQLDFNNISNIEHLADILEECRFWGVTELPWMIYDFLIKNVTNNNENKERLNEIKEEYSIFQGLSFILSCKEYRISNICDKLKTVPRDIKDTIIINIEDDQLLQLLKWLLSNKVSFNNIKYSNVAALYGHTNCLKFYIENGCSYEIETINMSVFYNNLDCATYLHEKGCVWEWQTVLYACFNGSIDCFKYLINNDCPFTIMSIFDILFQCSNNYYLYFDNISYVLLFGNENPDYLKLKGNTEKIDVINHQYHFECLEYIKDKFKKGKEFKKKWFNEIILSDHGIFKLLFTMSTINDHIKLKYIKYIETIFNGQEELEVRDFFYILKNAELECLKYIYTNDKYKSIIVQGEEKMMDYAVISGSIECVEYLRNHYHQGSSSSPFNNKTISYCVTSDKCNFGILDYLYKYGCNVSSDIYIDIIKHNKDISYFKYFHNKYFNNKICNWDNNIFNETIKYKKLDMFKYMIANGFQCNKYSTLKLISGKLEEVEELYEKRLDNKDVYRLSLIFYQKEINTYNEMISYMGGVTCNW